MEKVDQKEKKIKKWKEVSKRFVIEEKMINKTI